MSQRVNANHCSRYYTFIPHSHHTGVLSTVSIKFISSCARATRAAEVINIMSASLAITGWQGMNHVSNVWHDTSITLHHLPNTFSYESWIWKDMRLIHFACWEHWVDLIGHMKRSYLLMNISEVRLHGLLTVRYYNEDPAMDLGSAQQCQGLLNTYKTEEAITVLKLSF